MYTNTTMGALAGSRSVIGRLGQTQGEYWYRRSKAAQKMYQDLVNRVAKIANKQERDRILNWLGSLDVEGTPAYRYNRVQYDTYVAEQSVPTNYSYLEIERRQSRVEKLEDWDAQLEKMVKDAEARYGTLPEAPEPEKVTKVIEKEKIVEKAVTPEFLGMPVTTWALLGGAAALAAVGFVVVSSLTKAVK